MGQRQYIETYVRCFRYIGFIVEVGKNHVMRAILRKTITIKIIGRPEVQVEFHPFDGLGRQNRAIYITFSYIIAANVRASNRPGGTLISAARTAQQVEIEQVG